MTPDILFEYIVSIGMALLVIGLVGMVLLVIGFFVFLFIGIFFDNK